MTDMTEITAASSAAAQPEIPPVAGPPEIVRDNIVDTIEGFFDAATRNCCSGRCRGDRNRQAYMRRGALEVPAPSRSEPILDTRSDRERSPLRHGGCARTADGDRPA